MAKTVLEGFPTDILVDSTKSHEAVFVHPDQSMFADGPIAEAFDEINADYAADREGRFRFLERSTHHFRTRGTFGLPAPLDVAYLSGPEDAESDEIMVATSPLNDGRPRSSADTMIRFINTEDPSALQIAAARPNSWGPAVKFDIWYQLSQAMDRPMAGLQLFSPMRPRAVSVDNRQRLWEGDYSAYGEAIVHTLRHVNEERRRVGKMPVAKVHLFGAGIAQRAAGAARFMAEEQDEFEPVSVALMNLSLQRGVKGTMLDHMTQAAINEASKVNLPSGHVRIEEPLERQDQDHKGTDTLQMYGRQAWAIKDLAATTLPFMTRYEPTVRDIEELLGAGIPVRLINGLNVGMAIHTLHLLPVGDRRLGISTIVGMEGQKVTMMSNEHAGVVAVAMSLGIRDYDLRQRERRSG